MAYTEKDLNKIVELYEGIEGNKKHEYAAPTYKDKGALKDIVTIVFNHLNETSEELIESIPALAYVADCYDKMCRAALSAKYYRYVLEFYVKLSRVSELNDEDKENFENILYSEINTRNYYESDDCRDIEILLSDMQGIPQEKINDLFESYMENRGSHLKYDPVEMTDEYLAVIDDVEELIDLNKTMDFCYEYWNLKAKYLAKFGIHWQSPAQLNRGVMFD